MDQSRRRQLIRSMTTAVCEMAISGESALLLDLAVASHISSLVILVSLYTSYLRANRRNMHCVSK